MQTLDYRGYRLKYVDRGEGEPIVFLHNGVLSHRLWDYQLDFFEQTHRVVAPDLLGHGQSDRPDTIYTADEFVSQVLHLVDELELQRFHLIGCCLGGGVGLEFARRYPERVRTLSLITVDTPRTVHAGLFGRADRHSIPGSPVRTLAGRLCETPLGRWLMSRAFYRVQCGPIALSDPAFRAHVDRMYRHAGTWRVFCNSSVDSFAGLDQFSKPEGFPPTLMMWGKENRVLPARAGEELAARVQPDRIEFWDGCGYMLMRERPTQTNEALASFMRAVTA